MVWRWKYWKLSQEQVIIAAWVQPGPSEPKQQSWLQRPLKTNLNSVWQEMFIYPTDTGLVAPGQLIQPCSIFHIFTRGKQRHLRVLLVLKYVKMWPWVCACCVCDGSSACSSLLEGAALFSDWTAFPCCTLPHQTAICLSQHLCSDPVRFALITCCPPHIHTHTHTKWELYLHRHIDQTH